MCSLIKLTKLIQAVAITIDKEVAATIWIGNSGNKVKKIGTMSTPPPIPKMADIILVIIPHAISVAINEISISKLTVLNSNAQLLWHCQLVFTYD